MASKTATQRSSLTKRSDNHQRRRPIQRQAQIGGAPNPAEMQRRLGNQGTQAWLAEQKVAQRVQAKLTAEKSDEIHKQAANNVAETRMPEPVTSSEEEPFFQTQPVSSQITSVGSTKPKKMAQAMQPLVQIMPDVGVEQDKEAAFAQKPLIQKADGSKKKGDEGVQPPSHPTPEAVSIASVRQGSEAVSSASGARASSTKVGEKPVIAPSEQPLVQIMPDVGVEQDKRAIVAQKPLIQIAGEVGTKEDEKAQPPPAPEVVSTAGAKQQPKGVSNVSRKKAPSVKVGAKLATEPTVAMLDVRAEQDKEAASAQKPLMQKADGSETKEDEGTQPHPTSAEISAAGAEQQAEAVPGVSEIKAPSAKVGEKPEIAPLEKAKEGPVESKAAVGGAEGSVPEKVAAPNPREAIAPAIRAVRNRAAGASKHRPSGAPVTSAQAAGQDPQTEQNRLAALQTVENLDAEKENTQEIKPDDFQALLKKAIREATPEPKSESEAERVMKTGASDASEILRGNLAVQEEAAAGPLKSAASNKEPSSNLPQLPPKTDLELEQVGEPPLPVSAAPVVPAPLPPERLDYSSDRGSTDQVMAENNVSEAQLAASNEPSFGLALETRAVAEEHEATVATRYRKSESNVRAESQGRGQQALAQGLTEMHGGRTTQIGMVVGEQTSTENKNKAEKLRITTTIKAIKDKTQKDVSKILDDMETEASREFESGLKLAEKVYKDTFEDAKGGVGTWLTNWGDDWVEVVEDALTTARNKYLDQVDIAIVRVANIVKVKLAAAKQRVSDGLAEVQKFVDELDANVKQFGEDALNAVTADFDAMRSQIDERRDGLVNKITQQYKDSYERMSAMEEQLRAENKSLWQRAYDATVGVVLQIVAFKDMLLGILARAAAVVESIIQDPIGFLGNLISGIKSGLDLFFGNIVGHLKRGLLGWLFGALEGAGIQLPDSFDFKGILSLIMQVLGLTYAAIRKRAVKLLGEDMVSRLEQVAEIFKILFTEGPAGLWRMLMEQLSGIKDMLLEEIRGFVISEIIEAGIKWLIGLLNPAAAFIKACMMIYDIIIFFIDRGSQIVELVNAIINSLGTIVSGKIQAMAVAVESALGRILPVAISFLAALVGLGGISGKIREIISKVQEPIGKAVDWVIGKAVQLARAAGNLFKGGGKKGESKVPETDDPEHDAKVTAGLTAIDTAEQAHLENGEITRENAEDVARLVRQQHPVFTSLQVVDGGETWDYDYTASPGTKKTGEEKKEATDPPSGVVAINEDQWKIDPAISVSFNVRTKFDPLEYDEQLQDQQRGMNALSVARWKENRAAYEARGLEAKARKAAGLPSSGSGRSAEGAQSQRQARLQYRDTRLCEVLIQLASDPKYMGKSQIQLESIADEKVATEMSKLHALHGPDQVAGGEAEVTGLGSARINMSIGAQWVRTSSEEWEQSQEDGLIPRRRVAIIEDAVDALALDEDGKVKTMMNVWLQPRFIE